MGFRLGKIMKKEKKIVNNESVELNGEALLNQYNEQGDNNHEMGYSVYAQTDPGCCC